MNIIEATIEAERTANVIYREKWKVDKYEVEHLYIIGGHYCDHNMNQFVFTITEDILADDWIVA
jgi:hypothetical protein